MHGDGMAWGVMTWAGTGETTTHFSDKWTGVIDIGKRVESHGEFKEEKPE